MASSIATCSKTIRVSYSTLPKSAMATAVGTSIAPLISPAIAHEWPR